MNRNSFKLRGNARRYVLNREDVEKAIECRLAEREKRVLNRNALSALFSAVADPIGSLGKIFLGGEDALVNEKLHIQQDIVIDLLCQIDEAISYAIAEASKQGVDWTIISGEIEAHGVDTEEVTGARIASDAGPTEIKPGTHIRAYGERAKRVTGLEVGDNPNSKGE